MSYGCVRTDRSRWLAGLLLLVLYASILSAARALDVPTLTGRVVDNAGLLDESVELSLTSQLAALEQDTGAQLVVLTIPGLQGEVLEDFSLRVAERWKPGRKGFDDGVLLLVARDDRGIRIEVGYGLEGVITDLEARRVIDYLMVPAFRADDYAGGITAAVTALSGSIRGEQDAIPQSTASLGTVEGAWMGFTFFSLFLIPFGAMAVALKGSGGWTLFVFMTPLVWGVGHMFGSDIAIIVLVAWSLLVPLLRFIWPEKLKIEPGTGGGGGSTGSSSGYSSSGGFSGGGGSFGGGGASGRW